MVKLDCQLDQIESYLGDEYSKHLGVSLRAFLRQLTKTGRRLLCMWVGTVHEAGGLGIQGEEQERQLAPACSSHCFLAAMR
jgi:hypothetical protein